jgi:hypothetical protein
MALFAVLDLMDLLWIGIIVSVITGLPAVGLQVIRLRLSSMEMQLMRLERKVDLLVKYSPLSEGDHELLREIEKNIR